MSLLERNETYSMTSDASEQTPRQTRCNYQFRNHKIFNPCKNRSVNLCPSVLFMNNCIQLCSLTIAFSSALFFVASSLFIIYLLLFVILLVLSYLHSFILLGNFEFCFCSFCSFCFIRLFDIWFLRVNLSWYWKCVSGISIPITTTIRQVNKHLTTRLRLLLS